MAIADRVNISVPSGRHLEVYQHVKRFCTGLGAYFLTADILQLDRGTMKITERPRFTSYSVSGAFLQALRDYGSLEHFLFYFGEGSHKVSMLHIAQDFHTDAPPVLKRLRRLSRAKEVKLTRKYVEPKNVRYMESHNYSDPSVSTGMLYIGSPNAEVRGACYDKRNERIEKGFPDPGPLLRGELRVTDKMRVTLKDVVLPNPCYWHFMSNLFPKPDDVSPWSPNDHNYSLDPPVSLETYQLLQKRIDTSPDIADLLALTGELGPNGFTTLVRLLRTRTASSPINNAVSNKAA
jgi:hypothetical protein